MQAQHMILHDSASGQLVQATIPSINLSSSAALQNLLQPQASSHPSSSSHLQEDFPFPQSRPRSCQRQSPSPNYHPRSLSPRGGISDPRRYDDWRYEDRRRYNDQRYSSRRYRDRHFNNNRHQDHQRSESQRCDERRQDAIHVEKKCGG